MEDKEVQKCTCHTPKISGNNCLVCTCEITQIQIGVLNRDYGYVGYLKIPKGAPVYKTNTGRVFFEMQYIMTGEIHRQYFRDGDLDHHINSTPSSSNCS